MTSVRQLTRTIPGPAHRPLQPVYLGEFARYGNVRKQVSAAVMRRMIMDDAATWTPSTVPDLLEPYFEPIPERAKGYRVKPYHAFDIDHIIPKCYGGVDHPRNYCVMASSLNRSFRSLMDEKVALLGRHNMLAVRRFIANVGEQAAAHMDAFISAAVEKDMIPEKHY